MIAWLRMLVGLGLALGVVLTGLGWLAQWWPALDLVNNGLPALAAGASCCFVLALVTRDWRSIALAGLLAAINIGLIFAGLARRRRRAPAGSKRFLRVVTFNIRFDNDRIDGVDKFLNATDADVVVLQEVTKDHMRAAASRDSTRAIPTVSASSASSSSPNIRSRPTAASTGQAIPNGSACWRAGSSST